MRRYNRYYIHRFADTSCGLSRGKNDTHEVFLLESIDNEINREFCEEILEILNQIQKVNFYGNRTCLSIP